MKYVNISEENREFVINFITRQWYSTKIVVRGKEIDMTTVDGVIVTENDTIIGLITYIFYDDICEIISLDSLLESKGIGTTLVNNVILIAKDHNCRKVVLITTNDNINAIRFYQKRGFDMVHFYHNALDISRKLKPEIPLIGDNNIPLKHEIEFEFIL
jgi:ribosomal protein S18 acetylase RimI-like enzyme